MSSTQQLKCDTCGHDVTWHWTEEVYEKGLELSWFIERQAYQVGHMILCEDCAQGHKEDQKRDAHKNFIRNLGQGTCPICLTGDVSNHACNQCRTEFCVHCLRVVSGRVEEIVGWCKGHRQI